MNVLQLGVVEESYEHFILRDPSMRDEWICQSVDDHNPVVDANQSCDIYLILRDLKLLPLVAALYHRVVKSSQIEGTIVNIDHRKDSALAILLHLFALDVFSSDFLLEN